MGFVQESIREKQNRLETSSWDNDPTIYENLLGLSRPHMVEVLTL